MKKMSYVVLTMLLFFTFSLKAAADTKVVIITGDDVRFRDRPTVDSNIIGSFDRGKELTLINENGGTGNGCSSKWYQVKNNGIIGYVCGDFAKIETVTDSTVNPDDYPDYREYLVELGFPDSYLTKLIQLHNSHPNWQFRVYSTNLDFNNFINTEYDVIYRGWSLIEDTGRYFDGYKSTDSWSYNYLTDTFSTNFAGGGRNWYAANKTVIGYYLDPRNFLNDKQVFMFETLSYNPNYHTRLGIEKMLSSTFMTGYANSDHTKTYVDAFIDAAVKYNVSPYVLIARVIQEVGANGSTIVSGTVPGYEGYYNFYNINATGAQGEIITNGLKHAKAMGWNSPYAAIVGGGSFLADDYINQGQDTLYLQKWDLIQPNEGRHQYMQNIQAPSTESIKTYNGYNNVGLVNEGFTFLIPVFKNMPDKTNLPSSGSPNNYLSTLSVNGSYLFNSPTTKTSFDLVLDSGTTSIQIDATKVNAGATINGTGGVSITSNNQTFNVVVTAVNGAKRTYSINVTRKQAETGTTNNDVALDISEILRVLNVKNDGTYILGYGLNTDIANIIKSITDKESKATVTYTDRNNNVKTSGNVAGMDKLRIKTDREDKTYTIIVYGDVNGDSKVTSADYIAIKNHIMDAKKLNNDEQKCADAADGHDGKVTSADYIAIKNHIMDVKKITQ